MPLNSIPPTTTVDNLNVKRDEAKNVGTYCDVGFWGGMIPGNEKDLGALLDQGVKGFKCFLIESGVDVSAPRPRKVDKLFLTRAGISVCPGRRPGQSARCSECSWSRRTSPFPRRTRQALARRSTTFTPHGSRPIFHFPRISSRTTRA